MEEKFGCICLLKVIVNIKAIIKPQTLQAQKEFHSATQEKTLCPKKKSPSQEKNPKTQPKALKIKMISCLFPNIFEEAILSFSSGPFHLLHETLEKVGAQKGGKCYFRSENPNSLR